MDWCSPPRNCGRRARRRPPQESGDRGSYGFAGYISTPGGIWPPPNIVARAPPAHGSAGGAHELPRLNKLENDRLQPQPERLRATSDRVAMKSSFRMAVLLDRDAGG